MSGHDIGREYHGRSARLAVDDAPQDPVGGVEASRRSAMSRRAQARDIRQALQKMAGGTGPEADREPHTIAASGLAGHASALPHRSKIQRSFGGHDVSQIQAHVGGPAAEASRALGARAYATGDSVAFADPPDLHTAAHEAAHVVQQRGGVQLAGGVGAAGDRYEAHADAVADAVVAGRDASGLLDQMAGGTGGAAAVQRQEEASPESEAVDPAAVDADAAAMLAAFQGAGTDEDTVIHLLSQPPERVKALRDAYDARYDNHHGEGLVNDLVQELTGFGESARRWRLISALLQRAGIRPPGPEQIVVQPGEVSDFSIQASPAQPTVAPGTSVTYAVRMPQSIHDRRSRWTFQWYRVNDQAAADAEGEDVYEEGPRTMDWTFDWELLGSHQVFCRIQFISSSRGPETPITVEYAQTVKTVDAMAKAGFEQAEANDFTRFRAGIELHHLELADNGIGDQSFGLGPSIRNSGPNPAMPGRAPDLASHTYTLQNPSSEAADFRWYTLCEDWSLMPTRSYHGFDKINVRGQDAYDMGTGDTARWIIAGRNVYTIVCEELDAEGNPLGTAARYVQSVQSSGEARQVEEWRKYLGNVDEQIQTIDPDARIGLKTTYVNEETGATAAPALFIGPAIDGSGDIRLLDLTPGVPRMEYSGETVAAAIDDFAAGNAYPVGQIELEVPANESGVTPARRTLETTGASTWMEWSGRLGWTSLGLGILGIGLTLAPIPGSRVAAAAVFTAAAGTGAAAGGLSLYDQLQQTEVSARSVAIDVLGIAASIVGGATAFRALRAGQSISLANRSGRFLLYTGVGADVAQGILITPDFITAIEQILDEEGLSDSERIGRIVRVVANFALMGGLIALSTADLRSARSRVQGHVSREVFEGLDDDVIRLLDQLDDDALAALSRVTSDDLRQVAALVRIDAHAASRLTRLLGTDFSQHAIEAVDGGLLRINGQLDVHPRALAQVTDDDLKALLDATRSGDPKQMARFSRSSSYRFRFQHNLDEATDFIERLFAELGLADDARVRRLIDQATDADKSRLYDLRNASYPGGEIGKRIKTKAASYALGRNPPNARMFVEYFEMYVSEFNRRAQALQSAVDDRVDVLVAAVPPDQRGDAARVAARRQATEEILGVAVEGRGKSFKSALRHRVFEEMGDTLDSATISREAREGLDARYTELADDFAPSSSAGVRFEQPDAGLVGEVRALSDVQFGSESAAVYHANKHVAELPPSHRAGQGGELTAYMASARQTIDGGTATVIVQQNGTKQIVFTRTWSEAGRDFSMTARVNVYPDGRVVLATYMGAGS